MVSVLHVDTRAGLGALCTWLQRLSTLPSLRSPGVSPAAAACAAWGLTISRHVLLTPESVLGIGTSYW